MKGIKKAVVTTGFLALAIVACAGWGKKKDDGEKVVILYPGEESDRMTEFLEETLNPKLKEEAGI